MWPSFGKIELQPPSAVFGSEITPCPLEWQVSFTDDGIPRRESSTAGSSNPTRPPSCGSSSQTARGFGRCSFRQRLVRFAVMIPPNEKPK